MKTPGEELIDLLNAVFPTELESTPPTSPSLPPDGCLRIHLVTGGTVLTTGALITIPSITVETIEIPSYYNKVMRFAGRRRFDPFVIKVKPPALVLGERIDMIEIDHFHLHGVLPLEDLGSHKFRCDLDYFVKV